MKITAREVNVQAQRFYEASGLNLWGTDKPKIVAGLRAVLTNLGFEIEEDLK